MSERRKRITTLSVTVGLVGLNLIAFNALLGATSMRVDLTEEGVYSITPATKRLLRSLEEKVTIEGYFSERTHPKLAPLVPRIEDLLQEYRAVSRGSVEVEIRDPSADAELERDIRDRYGVESTPFRLASKYETGIVNAYFAIVIKYGDQYVRYGFRDLIEVEPLPDGDVDVRLRNLEYDLTRGIKKAVYGFRGAAELFERVEGVVRFTAVMTPDTLPELLSEVPAAVRGAAAELEEKGGEKFEFVELNPQTSEQDAAVAAQHFGVRPMSLGLFDEGRPFYLYGFLETPQGVEQISLATENASAASIREAVEDSLRRQTPGFLSKVGVVAPEPMIPPELMMQLQMQGRMPPQPPPEFEQVQKLLELDYAVESVKLDDPVPTDVDVLLVLKPRSLDETEVFHLDQYLMRGGRVIVCLARFAADVSAQRLDVVPVESGLDDWLAHFGVNVDKTLVLDDQNQPMLVPDTESSFMGLRRLRYEPYPYLVRVTGKGLVERQVAGDLDSVGLYWASPITLDAQEQEGLRAIELLRSSDRSWTDPEAQHAIDVIRNGYEVPAEGTEARLLGVALSGEFPSYFAGKEPPRPQPSGEEGSDDEKTAEATEVPLERSPDTRLVVVGSAEFLSDFVATMLGTLEGGFFDENLVFVQNLIDWVNLDNDMLTIRSRGAGVRRLAQVATGTEKTIELLSYVAVLAALVSLAVYRTWRRRTSLPLVARRAGR